MSNSGCCTKMEEELRNLIKVGISALISMSYCYFISSKISKGFLRLLSLLPICILFLVLPLFLSSVHFCGMISLFLSWLANFKLLLFAFDQGPLCPLPSNLFRFICLACFPIKIKQNPSPNVITNLQHSTCYNEYLPKCVLSIKVLVFGVLLHVYEYSDALPEIAVLALYGLHTYLEVEIFLVFVGAVLSTLLRCDIDPVFNEPYLATSLQDFWSRRWNLMVPAVLRSTVYIPVQRYFTRLLSRNKAIVAGILASFFVSGFMHELIYFYVTRQPPTWEVTCFFVLHGVATSTEIAVKKTEFIMRWRPLGRSLVSLSLHRVVSGLATLAFLTVTGLWLFVPQLLRNNVHERAIINECLWVVDLAKRQVNYLINS